MSKRGEVWQYEGELYVVLDDEPGEWGRIRVLHLERGHVSHVGEFGFSKINPMTRWRRAL